MIESFDLVIKGGAVVDGTGMPRYRGDVWIKDGRIAAIGGRRNAGAERVIDADGLFVGPGFVDTHTHYDAQIRWDPWCSISGWHGATTVVLGNCGFGFAPVHPEFRERSMLTMVRNEAIPYVSMSQGLLPHWDWETIPEYLDSLDAAPKGVNVIQYMPTASLMIYVMGLEAAKSRPATPSERAEMQRLLHEGMDAGLCGFSIQRAGPNSPHADYDGSPMVTDTMVDEDILCLAEVLAERDEGFIQITQSTGDVEADLAFVKKLASVSGRPVMHNAVFPTRKNANVHRDTLRWIDSCWADGAQVWGQGATVRSGFVFSLEDWNLYDASPAWRAVTVGSREEKKAKMADPELRAGLIAEAAEADRRLRIFQAAFGGSPKDLVVQGVNRQEELQKYVGRSVGEIAEVEGKHPIEVMLDLSIATDLNAEFLGPNRGHNVDFMCEIVQHPYTVPGVSDGGAHVKFLTAGSYPTDLLRWLVRDENRVRVEEAHHTLAARSARAVGVQDRGVLREGAPADVLVYDLATIDVEPDWVGTVVHDMPGGEWRRVQRSKGYKATIVNGEVTFLDGECTGATPGRLLRHGRG